MTTREIASLIKYTNHRFNPEGTPGIRGVLNMTQNLLLCVEQAQNLAIDATTGDFPLLTTTAGTYQYNCPADCWRTANILLTREIYYGTTVLDDYGRVVNMQYPITTEHHNGKEYIRYQQVRSYDATENALARIVFLSVDPGSYTDRYYHMYYKRPTQTTSLSVLHSIPSPNDIEVLLPAAQAIVEGFENGSLRDAISYVTKVLRPKLWHEMNSGAQARSYFVTRNEI